MKMGGFHLKFWQSVVFGLLWLAYGSTYFLRKPLGVIKADLEVAFNVSSANLGWLDSALLLPYAGISLTLGSLGDRIGSRITLAGGLILAAAATAPMTVCQSFTSFLVLLAFSGASQALCWPACCSLLACWFSDASRNSVFGLFGTCIFACGMAATGLTVYLQAVYGWRGVFVPPAVIVVILGVMVLILGRNPDERGLVVPGRIVNEQKPHNKKSPQGMSMYSVWRISLVPEVSLAMFCVKFVRYALMFWLPLYFLRSLNYSQVNAGLASTAFEIGGAVGSALVGIVVDRWMGGRAILASALAISGSALVLLGFMVTVSWGPIFHVIFLALAGAFNCGPDILLCGSVSSDIGEREGGAASAVTGVVNGMGSLGTVLEGPLVSLVTAWLGWSSMMPLMIFVSCVGALATFRANTLLSHSEGWVKISTTEDIP
ncbi:glucose-6-phosphate exchanger SLC37A2-like [Homarus americanus]|uniref:glucose-6-phosphate exchanger SLC37A2-like n=1 Tax=Homarus americanus TaxID=6706 RepID=UPI001C46AA96|nr:glucose-6-phosphate exchanger SLC37A2-like [Homarus americanus]XP_042204522.1 glucose-6-phosphate exchanger SLC37A2-like [Homarus americanus]XP_042204523.1 glucose-6-phosphate exchanger SLC37A2-like [Homarus americanus]XP_042204524.1 glucose-6-phosphate exchanger SLC37A2-like [Homarus americanus]XP_042204525.1 glucose-6-phosphate exchanger SLC37A2-like [Homarus americanus]XP_042204526.1 glucose-6-phosphate exchanger SLC37A2-like [Homarus americanus]XP_042204527.1 glucose-6-phosphate exchan